MPTVISAAKPPPCRLLLTLRVDDPEKACPDWIVHRAHVLDLSGSLRQSADGHLSIVAYGERTLLEAFEVACSLGPASARVLAVSSHVCTTDTLNKAPGLASEPDADQQSLTTATLRPDSPQADCTNATTDTEWVRDF